MNLFQTSKLLTCRYWALGSSCPNINQNGVNLCQYAHWDTGNLASSYLQRGTCANWLLHKCYMGNTCYYEHRYTGVQGLYQGALLLDGVNLEIADAAFHSGFNTFNHDALMNLVWSVRRVIMRNHGPNRGRPPSKDPIYPDRFRPSGIGDNTKRKRPGAVTSSPPPFHPVQPLGSHKMRKKNKNRMNRGRHLVANTAVVDQVLGAARVQKPETKSTRPLPLKSHSSNHRGVTQANPINLLSDSEDEKGRKNANTSAKRQKTSMSTGRYKVEDSATSQTPQANTRLVELFPDNNVNANSKIIAALDGVKARLETSKQSMVDCQLTMRDMFNENSAKLGEDVIFSLMERLSKEIFRAHDGARDGMAEVARATEWLNADDLRAKGEIS